MKKPGGSTAEISAEYSDLMAHIHISITRSEDQIGPAANNHCTPPARRE